LIHSAGQYALAMSIELEKRKLSNNQVDISSLPEAARKRAFELSAYFTVPELDPQHETLTLYNAMTFANKNKQLSSALSFANSLIEKASNQKIKEQVLMTIY
jgi:coatomer subunit alpha